jgi:hypothetical protein
VNRIIKKLQKQLLKNPIKSKAMGILSSLFNKKDKKKKKMEISEQTINDARSYYGAFDYQWIKGDDIGMDEKYKDIVLNGDATFIVFESGRRINSELLSEYVIMLPAQPVHSAPVNYPKPNEQTTVTSIIYEDPKIQQNDSPIYKLLKKQKKNMVDVSINIKLNLPSKDLYNVLSGSFEDAEREIIDFVLDGVDINDIKASLADSIEKSYYEKKETPKVQEKKALVTNNKKTDDE